MKFSTVLVCAALLVAAPLTQASVIEVPFRRALKDTYGGYTVCKVTGSATATNENSQNEIVKVTKAAVAEAKAEVCKGGDVDLTATASATAIAQAVGKAVAEASTEIFASNGCGSSSGGSASASSTANAIAYATATAVADASSYANVGGKVTMSEATTKSVAEQSESAIAKAYSSSELWGSGRSKAEVKVVVEAVATAVAQALAETLNRIKNDESACKALVEVVACNDSVREYCKYGGDAETDRLCKVAGCVQGESRG